MVGKSRNRERNVTIQQAVFPRVALKISALIQGPITPQIIPDVAEMNLRRCASNSNRTAFVLIVLISYSHWKIRKWGNNLIYSLFLHINHLQDSLNSQDYLNSRIKSWFEALYEARAIREFQ